MADGSDLLKSNKRNSTSSSYCELSAYPPLVTQNRLRMDPEPGDVNGRFSSYSELRGGSINQNQNPYHNQNQNQQQQQQQYQPKKQIDFQRYVACPPSTHSQGSSVLEGLYHEPIVPRADSQLSLSSRGSGSGTGSLQRRILENTPYTDLIHSKEAEIDELTNLLMNSLRKNEVFFGLCTRCGEQVVGEGNGCTAMGQVYHNNCLTCQSCGLTLQGKSFFYHVDGKPYCEKDYLSRLEKCCVCEETIVDRILRANGKPYHPCCFCCVVCLQSLEGIQFTIDSSNQIYCIEDFHKKFAPRCCVCQLPIMPEEGNGDAVRVVALDRSFHVSCYKCEDCGLLLRSEAEGRGCFPLDDHVLCKSCNAKRVRDMKI